MASPLCTSLGMHLSLHSPHSRSPLEHAVLQPREQAGRDQGGHGAPQAVPQLIGDMEISVIRSPSM